MKINRIEIIKFYDNMIDDIEDEELRDKLRDQLTDIDELLFSLECDIEKAIDEQDADYLPNYKASGMIDEFNDMCRREPIWYV